MSLEAISIIVHVVSYIKDRYKLIRHARKASVKLHQAAQTCNVTITMVENLQKRAQEMVSANSNRLQAEEFLQHLNNACGEFAAAAQNAETLFRKAEGMHEVRWLLSGASMKAKLEQAAADLSEKNLRCMHALQLINSVALFDVHHILTAGASTPATDPVQTADDAKLEVVVELPDEKDDELVLVTLKESQAQLHNALLQLNELKLLTNRNEWTQQRTVLDVSPGQTTSPTHEHASVLTKQKELEAQIAQWQNYLKQLQQVPHPGHIVEQKKQEAQQNIQQLNQQLKELAPANATASKFMNEAENQLAHEKKNAEEAVLNAFQALDGALQDQLDSYEEKKGLFVNGRNSQRVVLIDQQIQLLEWSKQFFQQEESRHFSQSILSHVVNSLASRQVPELIINEIRESTRRMIEEMDRKIATPAPISAGGNVVSNVQQLVADNKQFQVKVDNRFNEILKRLAAMPNSNDEIRSLSNSIDKQFGAMRRRLDAHHYVD